MNSHWLDKMPLWFQKAYSVFYLVVLFPIVVLGVTLGTFGWFFLDVILDFWHEFKPLAKNVVETTKAEYKIAINFVRTYFPKGEANANTKPGE